MYYVYQTKFWLHILNGFEHISGSKTKAGFSTFSDSHISVSKIENLYENVKAILLNNDFLENEFLTNFQVCVNNDYSKFYFVFNKNDDFVIVSSFELPSLNNEFKVTYE